MKPTIKIVEGKNTKYFFLTEEYAEATDFYPDCVGCGCELVERTVYMTHRKDRLCKKCADRNNLI